MNVSIYKGSILDPKVDAIVNPANSFLRHGGGLARIIDRAAIAPWRAEEERLPSGGYPTASVLRTKMREAHTQRSMWLAANECAPAIPTGDAHWTNAGRLPYKGVIHAVGPIYKDGSLCEDELLYLAYRSALSCAVEHGCLSIAFPAISCGIFGFPVDEAAPLAAEALSDWHKRQHPSIDVTFALMEDEHVEAFTEALGAEALI